MATPTVKLLNGSNLPVVGLGTWQSDNEKELEAALDIALENGYRHIDTAFVYRNEHIVGNVLQKWFSGGKLKREDIFVTTKLPMDGVFPDGVETFLKKSLTSLKLDYVDLYLIHFPVGTSPRVPNVPVTTKPTDHIAVWKKMEEQVDAGLTKTIGLSNFNIRQIDRILKNSRIKPASLQVENHIYLQQNELVKFAQDNGIVVVAYSPLANPSVNAFFAKMGIAFQQIPMLAIVSASSGNPIKELRSYLGVLQNYTTEITLNEKISNFCNPRELPNIFTNETIKSISDKHKKSSAQIALKYLLQRNIVVIPKSVSINRIKENIDLFNFTLDAQDMAAIRDLEIGENARVCDFLFLPALSEHPEFPFPKK